MLNSSDWTRSVLRVLPKLKMLEANGFLFSGHGRHARSQTKALHAPLLQTATQLARTTFSSLTVAAPASATRFAA